MFQKEVLAADFATRLSFTSNDFCLAEMLEVRGVQQILAVFMIHNLV